MKFWTRLVEAIRWKLSQRRIRALERQLTIPRRGFIAGLLLAPFTSNLSPDEIRRRITSEYLKTPQGRARLAQSMIHPMRRRLDYASLARKVFGRTDARRG